MTNDDDQAWRDAGFDDATRDGFRTWKIDVDTARHWRAVGVHDGLTAVRWQLARLSPPESSRWRASGFDSIEALQWRQMGHSLATAREAKQQGRPPSPPDSGPFAGGGHQGRSGPQALVQHVSSMARGPVGPAFTAWLEKSGGPHHRMVFGYAQAGWVTDDALPWVQAGIAPDQARLWNLLGLRPAEASALNEAGQNALDTTRRWWTAGIPLDQVAAWLGAGFTPEEAKEQMAAGVDDEQAAVLRALRDPEDD